MLDGVANLRKTRRLFALPKGKRLVGNYHRRRASGARDPVRSIAYVALGIVVTFVGLLLALPPGFPGFIVVALGLAMMAREI
jgi:hypothetical protein